MFLLNIISVGLAQCFYLPGVAPKDFIKDSSVPLLVNALTAKDSLLPYDYYHPGFSFCVPEKSVSQSESLGSILFGDRLFNSPFKVGLKVHSIGQLNVIWSCRGVQLPRSSIVEDFLLSKIWNCKRVAGVAVVDDSIVDEVRTRVLVIWKTSWNLTCLCLLDICSQ